MALRLIEMVIASEEAEEAIELVRDCHTLGIWQDSLSEEQRLVRILISAEETESVLDLFEKRFSSSAGFRIMLLPVEATLPRPESDTAAEPKQEEVTPTQETESKPLRISREELYADLSDLSSQPRVYLFMVVLSSVVAAIGLQRGNVAIIIGAMVIAPLLGPNVALALATTLADGDLARRALKASALGVVTALLISLIWGAALPVDPEIPEIASRTSVSLGDASLALAAGSAGVLALTSGAPATLIGVMVAVALLPPLVTFGLLLGSGHGAAALGALLLLVTNLICINLAGVATFLVQGIRPLSWWDANRAKKATWLAITLWTALLLALVVAILLSRQD